MADPATPDPRAHAESRDQQDIPAVQVAEKQEDLKETPTVTRSAAHPRIEIWLHELCQHSASTLQSNMHGSPTLYHASTAPSGQSGDTEPRSPTQNRRFSGIVKISEKLASKDGGDGKQSPSMWKEAKPGFLSRLMRRRSTSYVVPSRDFESTKMYEDLSCWGPAKPQAQAEEVRMVKQSNEVNEQILIIEERSEDGNDARDGLMERRERLERAARLLGKKSEKAGENETRMHGGLPGMG